MVTAYAKSKSSYVDFSTNGSLITEGHIEMIKVANFQYAGISIDGLEDFHDEFCRQAGCF